MENISKEFTYPVTDDQYSMTNEEGKTGTLTYNGPAKKYVVIDRDTNRMTGRCITESEWEAGFNDDDDSDVYAVEVNCDENTLICAMLQSGGSGINPETVPEIIEEIPGYPLAYTRNDPMLPDHVYEVEEIEYDPGAGVFVKPFPWKKPIDTWEDMLRRRNNLLANADKNLSEDLPTSIYNKVAKYKQWLRDLPEAFGVGWTVTIDAGGTGYVIGDRLLITDPRYKNGSNAPDILVTITEVNETGGITKFTRTTAYAHEYHPNAGSYENVFYSQNSANGTGAVLSMSKVKLVQPWKINILRNPVDNPAQEARNNIIDLL